MTPTSAGTNAALICLVSGALPSVRCGVGDYTDQLAKALARAGHDVVAVTTADPRVIVPAEYRVEQVATTWKLGDTFRIAGAVRRLRPAVVHVQYPGVGYGRGFAATMLAGALRLRGYKGHLVTTLHEFDSLTGRQRLRIALGAAAVDAIVAPDARLVQSVRTYTRWRPGLRVERIEIGPSIAPIQHPVISSLRRDRDELVVGFWGFLRPDKGVEVLLEAFALISRRRAARLILAGDSGGDRTYVDSLEQRIAELGIADDVAFTGDLSPDRLSATLLEFDVCALPFRDGLAANRTTYVTAVAHGLYVVTTSRDRTGFDPSVNTAFVPPGNAGALAEAINVARDRLIQIAPGDASARWDEIATAHLTLYGTS